jgi:hypothetical protein
MKKIKCIGQKPPSNGDLVVADLGYRIVKKGEVFEADETLSKILVEKYAGVLVYETVAEKNLEVESNKMLKKVERKKAVSEDVDFS